MKGFVLQARSGHFKVKLEDGKIIDASARKKTMLASKRNSPVVVGDFVEITLHEDGHGSIEKIHPRINSIQRGSESRKGKSHTIISNVDYALVVFAADKPRSRIQAIDRYLITAEFQHVDILLVFNKWDLSDEEAQKTLAIYENAGYPCLKTEALNNPEKTKEEILNIDFERLYILGPSGVGKSSIINALFPEYMAETGSVNENTGRGRHTTTHIEFRQLDDKRFIADTPGLGLLNNLGIEPNNLKNYYREFLEPAEECKFSSCLHVNEPNCKVKELVGKTISPERYESYLVFLNDLIAEEEEKKLKGKRNK